MNALNALSPIFAEPPETPCKPAQTVAEKIKTAGSTCFHIFDANLFPWIRPGDLAFVRRFDFEHLEAGNVILIQREGRLVLARVIRRLASGSHGSASVVVRAPEKPRHRLSHGEFLGKVIRIHRRKRHIDLESLLHMAVGRILAKLSDLTGSLRAQPPKIGNAGSDRSLVANS
ncbi:MAG TPA: hypothetical protein VLY23_14790 [Candidatus Acidoferrum sp.]|nr:hypothetical protein [Candidatus Acidoferrum sp.]